MNTLELEARKWIEDTSNHVSVVNGYIAGANSKWTERKKLQFTLEHLNKLDSIMQSKIEKLNTLKDDCDADNVNHYGSKIQGIKLTKEEIRKDIKKLEQILSEI